MSLVALLSLPIVDPVLLFGLAMLIFLVAPRIAERMRAPGMVGIIAVGILVGPHGLNLLARENRVVLLGTIGLLYLMFLAAAEIDLHGLRRHGRRSVAFGALGFLLPLCFGSAAALALGYGALSALLLGATFASHTLVAYPIALRLGIAKNPAVTTTLGATVITDTAALLVLAVVAAAARGSVDLVFWVRLVVPLALYVALVALAVPRLARGFFRRAAPSPGQGFLFVMALLFLGSFGAELAGVEPILGAFLVGLALNRFLPSGGALQGQLRFVGESVFIPFFLLSVGMLVDLRIFLGGGLEFWKVMGTLLAVALSSKWLAAWAIRRFYGYSTAEGWTMYGLSVARAAATLAIALVGYELQLFDDVVLNAVVLMILVSCTVGPWVVEKYGRQVALEEERRPYHPTDAPRRVLVPMSNPATAPALLDLAFLLRERDAGDPVYALTVVPEEGGRAEAYVANAEKMLSHAVAYGAAAGVSVQALTRVDQSFARGIARGMLETRTSTAIIGWDGRASRHWVFGSVLDQVLDQAQQEVIVAKLGHALNTTRCIVAVIPQGADRAPGFANCAGTLKRIASELSVEVHAFALADDPAALLPQLQQIAPSSVPLRCEGVADWRELFARLAERVQKDDLVVVLGARRDTVAWHPALLDVPARLARLVSESFLVLYPPEPIELLPELEIRDELRRALAPERIQRIEARTLGDAHRVLLERDSRSDPTRVAELEALLARYGAAIEIRPGVVVSHARVESAEPPRVMLGISSSGIAVPGCERPAQLLFLVLSPLARAQQHLAMLAEIARIASAPEGLATALRGVSDAADLPDAPRAATGAPVAETLVDGRGRSRGL